MKKIVLTYGLIAGLVVSAVMLIMVTTCGQGDNYEGNMLIGYASMLIAFSMIFVGVKSYRDKHLNGVISFGKAFKVGFLIALIASTFYVVAWLIDYHFFIPDFMDKYTANEISKLKGSGISASELASKTKDLEDMREMYKNPVMQILMTYAEILPVGLIVSLIAALILKKKPKAQA